ncbi:MAG: pirin family protein [Thermoleophilia bacterium]
MSETRQIKRIFRSRPTLEGAGVHLKRAFGNAEVPLFDPFLMLDDFRSDNPEHYRRGFPWHPHRGIETITYVLEGDVEHGDSMGNKGIITSGDVQWMTAGSGIIHQEMPQGDAAGSMKGFQLWANLPATEKMMDPRYRDVKSCEIPVVGLPGGVEVRVICGRVGDTAGPVRDIVTEPEYIDVTVPPRSAFEHPTAPGHTAIAYVISGSGYFDERRETLVGNEELVLFDSGGRVRVSTDDLPVRFLLLTGRPLGEPVAWSGPIVMNTREELRQAFEEYDKGTFIKHQAA